MMGKCIAFIGSVFSGFMQFEHNKMEFTQRKNYMTCFEVIKNCSYRHGKFRTGLISTKRLLRTLNVNGA